MNRLPFDPYDFFGYLASGLIVVVGMDLILGFPKVLGQEFKTVDAAILILGIYVAGQIVATVAKAALEDGLVKKILRSPTVNLFNEKKPVVRGVLFPGFYQPLPSHIRKKVLEKARTKGVVGHDEGLFLEVRYSREILGNEKILKRLDSFINQYGFSRNLAFVSIVLGVGLLVRGSALSSTELLEYGGTSLIVGIAMLYRYLKFFRQYSYEIFNTYGSE